MSDSKNPDSIHRSGPARAAHGAGTPASRELPFRARLSRPGGRHAAITTSLYNWHSYKNWADKVRGSWDDKK